MQVDARVFIRATVPAVWQALTDIEQLPAHIPGILRTERVTATPPDWVGLRWRETRLLFGEPATVEKWICAAEPPWRLSTRAEQDGMVFLSHLHLQPEGEGVHLISVHETRPQGWLAQLRALPLRLVFRGVWRRAVAQDLQALRDALERSGA